MEGETALAEHGGGRRVERDVVDAANAGLKEQGLHAGQRQAEEECAAHVPHNCAAARG